MGGALQGEAHPSSLAHPHASAMAMVDEGTSTDDLQPLTRAATAPEGAGGERMRRGAKPCPPRHAMPHHCFISVHHASVAWFTASRSAMPISMQSSRSNQVSSSRLYGLCFLLFVPWRFSAP